MPKLMEISELSQMLADRIEALCREMLPAGRREGDEWVEAKRARGGLGDALKVHLSPPRAGVWSHFAGNASGDALDLVAYARDCTKGAAVAWSKAWLGLDGADPRELERRRRRAVEQRQQNKTQAAAKAAKDSKSAHGIWLHAEKNLRGTPVAAYLAARGIDLDSLDGGRQPGALRYHPKLWCSEAQDHLPAMVAGITAGDGHFLAVHRTYLAERADEYGEILWRKADLQDPKKTWPGYRGGGIRLWRGESGKPLGRAAPGSKIMLIEGIEDGLVAALADPRWRVMVAVSLSNMAAVELPATISHVMIVADNDENNPAADLALDRARSAFLGQGRAVAIVRPPSGFKDLNDLQQGAGR